MARIFDIALKDLRELLRDAEVFLFFLAMPIIFTLLFGFAFGGFDNPDEEPRLPIGVLDQDGGTFSAALNAELEASRVVRPVDPPQQGTEDLTWTRTDLEAGINNQDLAGAVIIPAGYSLSAEEDAMLPLEVIVGSSSSAETSLENELQAVSGRLANTARIARIAVQANPELAFDQVVAQVSEAWETPPIVLRETSAAEDAAVDAAGMAHSSPSMMLQFSIAGLLTAAQIIVHERKTRCLQRLLTTSTSRTQILLGHYLAIVTLILVQFALLIAFGQLALKVNYMRLPLATGLVALTTALCVAALGLLIGSAAKTDEQAVVFAMIPMFVFAGLGGAWVPLEITGASFQAIGHLTPVAWGMDGFKNITVRGLGFNSVLVPCAALLGYAVLFFGLAAWRMTVSEER